MRGDINITELILCACCYGLNIVLSNSYAEALTPSVTVFGDRYYKETVKLKWGQKGRPWDDRISDLLRRDTRELALTLRIQQRWEHRGDHLQVRKRALTRIQLCWHSDIVLPVSELWENNFCCLNHSVYEKKWTCKSFSHIGFFVTPWIVARRTPLSKEFSRQEYWSGFPYSPSGDLPDPGVKPKSLTRRRILYHLSHQAIVFYFVARAD